VQDVGGHFVPVAAGVKIMPPCILYALKTPAPLLRSPQS
jgi:hypothetical protein